MGDTMSFPRDWKEFVEDYSFVDNKELYTNGARLISTFRVEQMIKHYFENPVIRSEWISVKDRLPEENGKYLCVVVHRGGNVVIRSQCVYEFISKAEDDSDLFYKGVTGPVWAYYDSQMGMCATARVTHWMPLPELPKEG